MKNYIIAAGLCLMLATTCHAQQNRSDSPATREEIVRYFNTIGMPGILQSAIDIMSKEMVRQTHDYVLKYPALPPDAEARLDKIVTENIATVRVDALLDAMIPVYQKYLTGGDLEALMAFYASPHGTNILRKVPAATEDGMLAREKVLQTTRDSISKQMTAEITKMVQEQSQKAPAQ